LSRGTKISDLIISFPLKPSQKPMRQATKDRAE
jgi:hypothetical protein